LKHIPDDYSLDKAPSFLHPQNIPDDYSQDKAPIFIQPQKPIPVPLSVNPVVKYMCKICSFEAETHEVLVTHEKDKHRFKCDICASTE
jgi:hypothetical protein